MELAAIFKRYGETVLAGLLSRKSALYAEKLWAIQSILSCRTPALGEVKVICPDCGTISWYPHSCGHRLCPKCQHHENAKWLSRQRNKLLPVSYFLITFTLPAELRKIARGFPSLVYNLLFAAAAQALKDARANPKYLGGMLGFTGVLHTHSRRLDLHPHIHFIVPGLAYNKEMGLCIQCTKRFVVPEEVLGRLFRGKLLSGLKEEGLRFETALYQKDWVVDAEFAGTGDPALMYLSRYLYRGVLSERDIVSDDKGNITFSYIESKTKKRKTRTETGERFIRLVLQHVLPKGFRSTRDYGFLHAKARKTLIALQLPLKAKPWQHRSVEKPAFPCPFCGKPTVILAVAVFRSPSAPRNRSPPALFYSGDLRKTA